MTSLSPMEMKPLISSPTTGGEGVTVGGVDEKVGTVTGVTVEITVGTGSGEESSIISVVVDVVVGGVV